MSFCLFLPVGRCSSIYQSLDHSFLLDNRTILILIHLDIQSRCTCIDTPFWSHSPILLVRLLDHHSNLLLLGNLEFWRMDSGPSENGVICSWVDSFLIVKDKDRNILIVGAV